MKDFEVGDRVRYVPDPEDLTSYPYFRKEARVAVVSTPEEAGRHYIGIRFTYNPEVYPARPDELERIEEDNG